MLVLSAVNLLPYLPAYSVNALNSTMMEMAKREHQIMILAASHSGLGVVDFGHKSLAY